MTVPLTNPQQAPPQPGSAEYQEYFFKPIFESQARQLRKRKADDSEPSNMALLHEPLAIRSKKVCMKTGGGEEVSGDIDSHIPPPQLAAPGGHGTPADCQDTSLGYATSGNMGPTSDFSHASDEVSVNEHVRPSSAQDEGEAAHGKNSEELQAEHESGHHPNYETPIRQLSYQQQVVGGYGMARTPGTMIQGTEHLTVSTGTHPAVFHGAAGAPGMNSMTAYTTPGTFATPGYTSSQFHAHVYQPGQFTHAGGLLHGYSLQTPTTMTYGNPIPTTHNQDRFRPRGFPAMPAASPLSSRAHQSQNWRTRAEGSNFSESKSQMMVPFQQPGPAPGHNINQGFNLFQPNTGYGGFPQFQGSTQFMHYQSHSSTIPQVGYNGRQEPSHKALFGSVNFFSYVPSSLHTYSVPSLLQIHDANMFNGINGTQKAHMMAQRAPRVGRECNRAAHNLPTIYTEAELDDDKWYARWSGGYVEVTDDLIARCICPADLLAHPCPWDELREGCQMVRLCKALEKNTLHLCEDRKAGFPRLEAFEGEGREYRCSHLHWEVEGTCRFVGSNKPCSIVTQKGYNCAVGHDFEIGRQVARSRFEAHVRDALLAGAERVVRRTSILNNSRHDHTFHLAMATGPGPLPTIHW